MPPSKRARRGKPTLELRYFGVMAKGLGPALLCEHSGLAWKGNADLPFDPASWSTLKPDTPFGQMPLLRIEGQDEYIAQTTAILNVVGKLAGNEGDAREYAVSQMLIAESEDIMQLMIGALPTINKALGVPPKGDRAHYDDFWASALPAHLASNFEV